MKTLKQSNVILLLVLGLIFTGITQSRAQLQQGNYLVGGDLADFNLSLHKGTPFSMTIAPKLATFISDNVALGGYLDLSLQSQRGTSNLGYGIGALGRYYANSSQVTLIKHSRIFFEGTLGIEGTHSAISGQPSSNTNGLGFGIGPGFSYFITPNVAVETLLKYKGIAGFGNTPYTQNLELNIGFQIFLPTSRIRRVKSDVMNR